MVNLGLKTDIENEYTNDKSINLLKIEKKESESANLNEEKATNSIWIEKKTFRTVLISTFSALAIVLGYLLAYLPNIELFTLIIFLSGITLGKKEGIMVGFSSSFIFCFFNPLGPSPLPLFSFQLFYYSFTGFLGGLLRNYLKKKDLINSDSDLYIFPIMAFFGLIGALITTFFQIFSTLIGALTFLGTTDELIPYFLTGIGFTIIHIIGNTLSFIFILPGLIQLINKMIY